MEARASRDVRPQASRPRSRIERSTRVIIHRQAHDSLSIIPSRYIQLVILHLYL